MATPIPSDDLEVVLTLLRGAVVERWAPCHLPLDADGRPCGLNENPRSVNLRDAVRLLVRSHGLTDGQLREVQHLIWQLTHENMVLGERMDHGSRALPCEMDHAERPDGSVGHIQSRDEALRFLGEAQGMKTARHPAFAVSG